MGPPLPLGVRGAREPGGPEPLPADGAGRRHAVADGAGLARVPLAGRGVRHPRGRAAGAGPRRSRASGGVRRVAGRPRRASDPQDRAHDGDGGLLARHGGARAAAPWNWSPASPAGRSLRGSCSGTPPRQASASRPSRHDARRTRARSTTAPRRSAAWCTPPTRSPPSWPRVAATTPRMVRDLVSGRLRCLTCDEAVPLLDGAAMRGRASDPMLVERFGDSPSKAGWSPSTTRSASTWGRGARAAAPVTASVCPRTGSTSAAAASGSCCGALPAAASR